MNQRGGNQNGLSSAWYLWPEPNIKIMVMVRETGTTMARVRDCIALLDAVFLVSCLAMVVLVGSFLDQCWRVCIAIVMGFVLCSVDRIRKLGMN